jgi:hypothetical protein
MAPKRLDRPSRNAIGNFTGIHGFSLVKLVVTNLVRELRVLVNASIYAFWHTVQRTTDITTHGTTLKVIFEG